MRKEKYLHLSRFDKYTPDDERTTLFVTFFKKKI